MKLDRRLESWRVKDGYFATCKGEMCGAFFIPLPAPFPKAILKVIATAGDKEVPWEHVSVSVADQPRCPYWDEMCFVKDLFWDEEEAVMQLHPARSQWINEHIYCLHLWRPLKQEIPLPPIISV